MNALQSHKLVNLYIRQHTFLQTLLGSFTTSERRRYERDIYDYARGIGFSRADAKKEVLKARGFCGEVDYNSDHSALEDEIDDSVVIRNMLLVRGRSPHVIMSQTQAEKHARPGLLKRRHTIGIDSAQPSSKRRKQVGALVARRNGMSEQGPSEGSQPMKPIRVAATQPEIANKPGHTSMDKHNPEEIFRAEKRRVARLAKTAELSAGCNYVGDSSKNVENVGKLQSKSAIPLANEVNDGLKQSSHTPRDVSDVLLPTEQEDLQPANKANHTDAISDASANANAENETGKRVKHSFGLNLRSSTQGLPITTSDTVTKTARSHTKTRADSKSVPDAVEQVHASKHFTRSENRNASEKKSRTEKGKEVEDSGTNDRHNKENGELLAVGQASAPDKAATEHLSNQRHSETYKTSRASRDDLEGVSAVKKKRARIKKEDPRDRGSVDNKQPIQESNLEPRPLAVLDDGKDATLKPTPSNIEKKGRKRRGKEDRLSMQRETDNRVSSTNMEPLSIPSANTEKERRRSRNTREPTDKKDCVALTSTSIATEPYVPTLKDTKTTKNPDFHSPMIQ